jgi:putative PEP-CTERM system TPR-repeat lipoprotein
LQITESAVNANPDHLGLLQLRGGAYLAVGDTSNSLAAFQRIAQLRPKEAETHYLLATAHAALKDGIAARKELNQALSLDPRHFNAKVALAQLNLSEAKLDDAFRVAGELRKDSPKAPEGPILQAEVLFRQNKAVEGQKVLEQAFKDNPNVPQIAFALARTRRATGDVDGAITLLKQWQTAHPDNLSGYRELGGVLLSLGRHKEAEVVFEAALRKMPEDTISLNNLAYILRKNDPSRALGFAEKAYQLSPGNAGILDTLGSILIEQGKTERGLDLLQKAFGEPWLTRVHYHYALALAKSGDKPTARRN